MAYYMGLQQSVSRGLSDISWVFNFRCGDAWGSDRTGFFPTYDYKAIGIGQHDKAR
jgi:hypothetical protein